MARLACGGCSDEHLLNFFADKAIAPGCEPSSPSTAARRRNPIADYVFLDKMFLSLLRPDISAVPLLVSGPQHDGFFSVERRYSEHALFLGLSSREIPTQEPVRLMG